MKAWTVTFTGHYPVGACAVVVATCVEEAWAFFHIDLKERGLEQSVPISNFVEVDLTKTHSTVILDGEY